MTKAPSDQARPGREARLQRALRENLMRRKEQMRARRGTAEAPLPGGRDDVTREARVVGGEEDRDSMGSPEAIGEAIDEASDEVKQR